MNAGDETEGAMKAGGMDADPVEPCPLCSAEPTESFLTTGGRSYRCCARCRLIFAAPRHRLGPAAEKARYDTHQNDPSDPGYRAFLARLADPLAGVLKPGATGLDYGSGPGPTLSIMMRERGFRCRDYDPFYAPDEGALSDRYDYIACTEVLEHLYRPGEELSRMHRLLRPGGWLGVMTEILQPDQRFEEWWYIRDPSHVCFYRPETTEWIAQRFGFLLLRPSRNVFLLQKDAPSPR